MRCVSGIQESVACRSAGNEICNWQRLNQVELVILGLGVNQSNSRISSFFDRPATAPRLHL